YAQHRSVIALGLAAGSCALFATLLALSNWKPRALHGIVLLGTAEMFWFAFQARPTFDSTSEFNHDEVAFLQEHPGDYRILNRFNPNSAMSIRVPEFWGYDASVVRRYAEFVTWTQGGDPDHATQDANFQRVSPLYAMLRLRYLLLPQPGHFRSEEVEARPLPHAVLLSKYRVVKNRDEAFEAMQASGFDPREEVILETNPNPAPLPPEAPIRAERPGRVEIVAESSDTLTIEAETAQPAILLITDVYTPSWRAVSLSGSSQSSYQLIPANYVLRA